MLSKEEIEKANRICKRRINELKLNYAITNEDLKAIETLLQYIDQLEQENKQYKEFITEANGKDIKDITATEYMKIKQEGYIQGRIEEQDKLIKCINKLNKMIDEMAEQLVCKDITDKDCFIPREYSDIDDCVKKSSCTECIKQYFEKKVEGK